MTYRNDIEQLTRDAESHAIATNLGLVEAQNAIALAILSLGDAIRGIPLEDEELTYEPRSNEHAGLSNAEVAAQIRKDLAAHERSRA